MCKFWGNICQPVTVKRKNPYDVIPITLCTLPFVSVSLKKFPPLQCGLLRVLAHLRPALAGAKGTSHVYTGTSVFWEPPEGATAPEQPRGEEEPQDQRDVTLGSRVVFDLGQQTSATAKSPNLLNQMEPSLFFIFLKYTLISKNIAQTFPYILP